MKSSQATPSPKRRSSRLAIKMKNTSLSPTKKRNKKSKTEFLALNNDCMDEICEWLPLNDLAAFGMTCKRLNQVASNYFRRKHPANYVLLSSSNGKVQLYPNEQYIQCFTQQFRNILFYRSDTNVLKYAATMFKEIPLRKVGFFATDDLTEAHVTCIDEIIKNAEIIEFTRCSSAGGLQNILKHCSNMKHLVLNTFTECKSHGHINEWLLQKYPTLEHLHWGIPGRLPTEMDSFFKNNANMNSFYGTEETLSFIRAHNITLNTLILRISSAFDMDNIFDQLRELCDQNAVQSLFLVGELRGVNSNLPKLNNLIGICAKEIATSTILSSFSHLKIITMEIKSLAHAKKLAQQLPNLEEAYIDVVHIDFIMPFVRFTPKLTKIYINNTAAMKPGSRLSLYKLEKLRKKMTIANKLTIYLKEEAYLKIKHMSIGAKCSTVEIKPIEAHIPNNVFVRYISEK